jgi:hypothetical protein
LIVPEAVFVAANQAYDELGPMLVVNVWHTKAVAVSGLLPAMITDSEKNKIIPQSAAYGKSLTVTCFGSFDD